MHSKRLKKCAEKAVAIDGNLGLTHARLGWLQIYKRQHDRAIESFERAIELSPNDSDTYAYFAEALNWAGDPERAIEMTKASLRFDPAMPPNSAFHWGHSCYLLRRYDEAIDRISDCIDKASGFPIAHIVLAAVYSELGRHEEAASELEIARHQLPGNKLILMLNRLPYRSEDARTRLLNGLRQAGLPAV